MDYGKKPPFQSEEEIHKSELKGRQCLRAAVPVKKPRFIRTLTERSFLSDLSEERIRQELLNLVQSYIKRLPLTPLSHGWQTFWQPRMKDQLICLLRSPPEKRSYIKVNKKKHYLVLKPTERSRSFSDASWIVSS